LQDLEKQLDRAIQESKANRAKIAAATGIPAEEEAVQSFAQQLQKLHQQYDEPAARLNEANGKAYPYRMARPTQAGDIRGTVQLVGIDGQVRLLKPGQEQIVRRGDLMTTGRNSSFTLHLADWSRATFGAGSAFEHNPTPNHLFELRLRQGAMRLHTGPLGPEPGKGKPNMAELPARVVWTPAVRMTAGASDYVVQTTAKETRIFVGSGQVEVATPDGRKLVVHANQQIVVGPGQDPLKALPLDPKDFVKQTLSLAPAVGR